MSQPLLVLIPSPLLGRSSWAPVADELGGRGWEAVIATELRDPVHRRPCWRRTVDGAAASLDRVADDRAVILVGHSGAGPLLPAIAGALRQHAAGYLFVDAGLPTRGASRLEAMEAEDPAFAAELRTALDAGGRFPTWTDDQLRELVPDAQPRAALLAELRPRGSDYWTEPQPIVSGWPNAPCGYLHFSPPYRSPADIARRSGWPLRHLPAGHFHLLVDPAAVASALLELVAEIGIGLSAPNTSPIEGGTAA